MAIDAKKLKLLRSQSKSKIGSTKKLRLHSKQEKSDASKLINDMFEAIAKNGGSSSTPLKLKGKYNLHGKEKQKKYKLKSQNTKMKDYHIGKIEKSSKAAAPIKPETKKAELPKWLDNHFSSEASKRLGIAAGIGAAGGVVASVMDKQDDDVLSTGEKIIKYSALGVGASYGGELALGSMGITSKHVAKNEVAKAAKKTLTEAEEVRWQKNMQRKGGVAMKIGIAAFAVATIADTFEGMEESRKASIERNRQEQELAKRQAAESRRQDKMGYGYTDYGQIVLQQWEKRVGHYAMGNAKFQ